ncbi:MAG: GPR endopeptidase, partial [Clostridia bacterium]|nr:GPR endopeptidase [Clostridia bacterium]
MIRTDLALERREMCRAGELPGVTMERSDNGDCVTTVIRILNRQGAEAIAKPVGTYITLETRGFPDCASLSDGRIDALCAALEQLLPPAGDILAVGLGNTAITPDALGPECAGQIIATRHLPEETRRELGLTDLRTVSVLTPGVAGRTGIETTEIIASVVKKIRPAAVLTIDALAAGSITRLAKTVQLCDTGIQPGSGVGNSRKAVNAETLGVPVIAVGVPTVVDAVSLAHDVLGAYEDCAEPPEEYAGM